MLTIIATIKPQHLCNIRAGLKLYEMRKTCPAEVPFRVLCCQSQSGGEIFAEFVVESPKKVRPLVWPELVRGACVLMHEAEGYANGKEIWFWDINSMIDYCSTKGHRVRNIAEFGLKRAPQSWCYVDSKHFPNGDCT